MFEFASNIKNQEHGSLDYQTALRQSSIDEFDHSWMEENLGVGPESLRWDDNTPWNPAPHWATPLTSEMEKLLNGNYDLEDEGIDRAMAIDHNNLAFPVYSTGSVEQFKKSQATIDFENKCEELCSRPDAKEGCFANCMDSKVTNEGLTKALRLMLEAFNHFALGEKGETYNEVVTSWVNDLCASWRETAEAASKPADEQDGPALRFRFMKIQEDGVSVSIPIPKTGVAINFKRGVWTDTGFYFGSNYIEGDPDNNHYCGWSMGEGGWWSIGVELDSKVPSVGILSAKLFGLQVALAMDKMDDLLAPWDWRTSQNQYNFLHNSNVNTISITFSMDFPVDTFGKVGKWLTTAGLVAGDGIQMNIGLGVAYPRPRVVDFPSWRENCRQTSDNMDNGGNAASEIVAENLVAQRLEDEKRRCPYHNNGNGPTKADCVGSTPKQMQSCQARLYQQWKRCIDKLQGKIDKKNESLTAVMGVSVLHPAGAAYMLATSPAAREMATEVLQESATMGVETAVGAFTGIIPETDRVIPSLYPEPGIKNYKDDVYGCDEECEKKCRKMDKALRSYKVPEYCDVAFEHMHDQSYKIKL